MVVGVWFIGGVLVCCGLVEYELIGMIIYYGLMLCDMCCILVDVMI